ncbi:cytochrome P450 [Streptomyces cyaneochromogenes]|uniref:Cytochrome P450 n=1 Tax=Streptomyces cyaneochromogenes TaxID=2496836 RepID=A0A3S9M206_9ACTN|nr:cytochrome P450 [Streptomyces cyaneochromogenes]AZQ33132.1 cytochrome P450 [Streptomyces cyaneochromogenes]
MTATPLHLTPELVEDPVRGYADLRSRPDLGHAVLPGLNTPARLITRYDDVRAALTEPRLIRDRTAVPGGTDMPDPQAELLAQGFEGFPEEYLPYLSGHLALFDGEEHTRRRNPLTRAFTARRVSALRPFVEKTAQELVAGLAEREQADLLGEFAYPLSTAVICELVGVDAADQERVCGWIRDFAYGDGSRIIEGLAGIVEYTKDLVARRRAEPTDDLVSALLADGGMSDDEIVTVFFLLINTGITPPALFLAHGVLALLDHPEQGELLRAEPELPARAVPELLRFVTLVRIGATLYAAEDFEFAGTPLKKGEAVTVALFGANHDPEVYEVPERLDVTREFGRGDGHLAFGHGPHYCIGAALGRVVTGVVLEELFVRRPAPVLAVDRADVAFGHWPGDGFHLLSLPVRL